MYNKLIEAAHKFLRKCDAGLARSTETRAELTEALQDPRVKAFKAIDSEREYQDAMWGANKRHTVGEWILLMEEAVVKARSAWYKAEGDDEALDRIRVVGSLAVCCMEHHKAIDRNFARGTVLKEGIENKVSNLVNSHNECCLDDNTEGRV